MSLKSPCDIATGRIEDYGCKALHVSVLNAHRIPNAGKHVRKMEVICQVLAVLRTRVDIREVRQARVAEPVLDGLYARPLIGRPAHFYASRNIIHPAHE